MRKELITHIDPKSPISEVFRSLRTNIQFMNSKTLLVTSTLQSEGKSWITSNLAVTFAQAGKKVVIVDADMRKGRQYNIFGVAPRPGLSNYLSGIDENGKENSNDILSYIKETDVENLYIIPAGNVPPNPSELLISDRMIQLFETLKGICDIVLFDGTPSLLVTDAVILSRMVDSTIIVTAHKETKIDNLQKVKKDIENVGGKIAGVIVNKIPISSKKYESTYYYGSSSLKPLKKMDDTKPTRRSVPKVNAELFSKTEDFKVADSSAKKDVTEIENTVPKIKLANNINLETDGKISVDKTEEILKQINEYLDVEKNKLNGKG